MLFKRKDFLAYSLLQTWLFGDKIINTSSIGSSDQNNTRVKDEIEKLNNFVR